MAQPYSSSGFYKTPVTKGLLILGCALSSSLFLVGPRYQNYFVYSSDFLLSGQELWRLLTCKLAVLEVHSLLLGAALLYHFRILERRYGSAKFASFLLANSLLCISVEAATVFVLHALEYNILPRTLCGPQSIIFSLFVPYILDVPSITTQSQSTVMTDFLSGKWMSYILGIYLMTLTHTSPLVIAYGIAAGILHRFNFLYIKSWLQIPNAVSAFCHRALGWLMYSRPPSEGVLQMGATLEIQRQQRMELLEQRMLLAQVQRYRTTVHRQNAIRRPVRQTFPMRRPGSGSQGQRASQQSGGSQQGSGAANQGSTSASANSLVSSFASSPPPPTTQPQPQDMSDIPSTSNGNMGEAVASVPEDRVQQLVDMGFNRAAVMQALRMSRNDITMATTVLLKE